MHGWNNPLPPVIREITKDCLTHRAIAGLVSDRSARRATRRRTSTELVPVRTTTR
ncbi:hypothetical protein ACFVT1_34980 [Streptomyces sp. NPDC057963]|uniref:hypothetical protein n=1 Tax=Streptomyces sp. NPDC057963 TaxID=3346290 RepID=UPI0036DFB1B9